MSDYARYNTEGRSSAEEQPPGKDAFKQAFMKKSHNVGKLVSLVLRLWHCA